MVKKRKSVRCSAPLFHSVVLVVTTKIPRLLEIQNPPRSRFVVFWIVCNAETRPSFESTSEEEYVESTKPTFYPHSFKERESEFDVDSFLHGNVMDRIQEDRFKGFYNFTFIYLVATVTMLVVRLRIPPNSRFTTSPSAAGFSPSAIFCVVGV